MIIATLLLIAIAVAAGIIVYVFVNSLAGGLTQGGGQQTTERLQMQSYNFVISPTGSAACSCSGLLLEIYLVNSGSSSTTISSVYYDGTLQSNIVPPIADGAHEVTPISGNSYEADSTHILTTTVASKFGFSTGTTQKLTYAAGDSGQVVIAITTPGATSGTSHTVKVVSTTGATYVFSVTAGRIG